jgi:hypothetical protein
MRALLCPGLIFLATLAAQSDVPGDQCLGGTLISIQQKSITTRFNEKIQTYELAPDAEIWRRGVDLESIQQLVIGDPIYLKCARAASGAVIASIIAAVEKDDAIELVPHHIQEVRVCGGRLLEIAKDALSVRNDDGICVIHLNPGAEIWRGEFFHDTSALKLGDDVMARTTVAYPSGDLFADEVEANITITEGKIVSVRADRIVVRDWHLPYLHGHMTVLLDRRTAYDLDGRELKKGAMVRAIGLDLGHNKFRATSVVLEN